MKLELKKDVPYTSCYEFKTQTKFTDHLKAVTITIP